MATPAARPSRPTRAALFFPAGLAPSRRRDVGARAFAAGAFRRPIVLISYLQLATGSGYSADRERAAPDALELGRRAISPKGSEPTALASIADPEGGIAEEV